MKKLFLAIAIACVCGGVFTSCDKDTRKCYKLIYNVEIAGSKIETTTYQWASANEIDAIIEDMESSLGVKVSKSVASSHKTIEDCIAANTGK